MLCQDEANVTDIATSSSYYGDPSIRPPRQVGPGYGSPPPVPVPDQNCYVETPCTRYRFLKKVGVGPSHAEQGLGAEIKLYCWFISYKMSPIG